MKRIKETILSKPIIEEVDREKLPETVLCRVTYNVCNIGERNANNRVYEKAVFDNVLNNDILKEMIENRRLFGQAEHPTETQSDLQLTSHVVHKMWVEDKIDEATKEMKSNVFQTLDVLDTPMGRIVDCLIRAGCGVGVSTRAEGDLEESEDDQGKFSRVIPESYKYITTDFTADPSTLNVLPIDVQRNVVSSVRAEMENKNATAGERKFAMRLFESISKVEASKKEIKLDQAIKDKILSVSSKIKYENKDFQISKIDEAANAITIRPDIQGRNVEVGQGEVLVTGSPTIIVAEDGTVTIIPVANVIDPEPIPLEEPAEEKPEQLSKPEEEKLEKELGVEENKTNEGMDQLVARKDELLTKKEAGKCTPEEQEELAELEKKLSGMGVDESKIDEGFKTDLKNKDKKAVMKRMSDITDKLLQGETLSGSDKIYWDSYYNELEKRKNESKVEKPTDLRIKEAITRAEKEKALEVIEELSEQISTLKNENSSSTLKTKMLMKKMKEATSVYDEVNVLRTKLEEKAKEASEFKKSLAETKVKLDETVSELMKREKNHKEACEVIFKDHTENVTSINESNQSRLVTVKEDYETKLSEVKQEGINEGITQGVAQVMSDYVDRRLAELGLSIGENTRALLDECGSIEDVEDVLDKTKDIQRRNALHSEPIEGIRIRNQNLDPEQARVDKEVGIAFEGMH